jgi:hypothetical protein
MRVQFFCVSASGRNQDKTSHKIDYISLLGKVIFPEIDQAYSTTTIQDVTYRKCNIGDFESTTQVNYNNSRRSRINKSARI